ncbi:hypothetical protein CR513_40123, partial [Mucuna pruriens]
MDERHIGKAQKRALRKTYGKRVIFFGLLYWCKLDVRYCIYVMHVEKNIYDSKTKNDVNARLNLIDIVGLKSHDCHVLMQQLLPMAICDVLLKNIRKVLTKLCSFFNAICSKVINPQNLEELENKAIIILCQLEIYFPPSFFNIMIHLVVYLVREIRLCDPMFLRWMYPIECYMMILKSHVKKSHQLEASIVERYISRLVYSNTRFTLVDLDKVGYKREPFIIESHSKQVFCVNDLLNKRWPIVLQ